MEQGASSEDAAEGVWLGDVFTPCSHGTWKAPFPAPTMLIGHRQEAL